MKTTTTSARHGFTLIELLVILFVVGILAALILPAVQSARESARRAGCLNNIRQLALALTHYQTEVGVFPPYRLISVLPYYSITSPYIVNDVSPQAMLLPALELRTLYDSINFSVPLSLFPVTPQHSENETAARTVVEAFLCPSDGLARAQPFAPISYRANNGPCGDCAPAPGLPMTLGLGSGLFTTRGATPAEMRDGLSQTVSFAEKLVGSLDDAFDGSRDWYNVSGQPAQGAAFTPSQWVGYCDSDFPRVPGVGKSGASWLVGDDAATLFFAAAAPNASSADCATHLAGVLTARSHHPGGVNASMADGSARFVKSSISVDVWRALSTRAGGEVLPSEAY